MEVIDPATRPAAVNALIVYDLAKPIFYSLSGLASGKSLISFARSWPFGESVVPCQ